MDWSGIVGSKTSQKSKRSSKRPHAKPQLPKQIQQERWPDLSARNRSQPQSRPEHPSSSTLPSQIPPQHILPTMPPQPIQTPLTQLPQPDPTPPRPPSVQSDEKSRDETISFANIASKKQSFASTSQDAWKYADFRRLNETDPAVQAMLLAQASASSANSPLTRSSPLEHQTNPFEVHQTPPHIKAVAKINKVKRFNAAYISTRGLNNRRLDCYLNSALQCLLSCPQFIHVFAWMKNDVARALGPTCVAMKETVALFTVANKRCQGRIGSAVRHPESLLDLVQEYYRLAGTGQQDVVEFLHFVMEHLHEECKVVATTSVQEEELPRRTSSKRKRKRGNGNILSLDEKVPEDNSQWVQVSKKPKARVTQDVKFDRSCFVSLFGCRLRSVLRVKKSRDNATFEPCWTIPIDISRTGIRNLSQALSSSLSRKTVDGIRRGNEKREGNKSYQIASLPKFLILQLKRFLFQNNQPVKLHKHVVFDVTLNVSPELVFECEETEGVSRQYALRSVIVHHGEDPQSGHYSCWCFRDDLRYVTAKSAVWQCIDDEAVRERSSADLKAQSAYVLCYERID